MSTSNNTIIETSFGVVLISYTTPVAFLSKTRGQLFVTEQKHSKTTTKHINTWLKTLPGDAVATLKTVPQNEIERLVADLSVSRL